MNAPAIARPSLRLPAGGRGLLQAVGGLTAASVGLYGGAYGLTSGVSTTRALLLDVANLVNLVTVLACVRLVWLVTGTDAAGPDGRRIRAVFGLVVVADAAFFAANVVGVADALRSAGYTTGIALFGVVQGLLIGRHLRGFSPAELRRGPNLALGAALLLAAGPLLAGFWHLATPLPAWAPPFALIAVYTVIQGSSVWAAFGARWRGVLGPTQANLAAAGMACFCLCDICVALQILTNPAAHPGLAWLPEVARVLIWLFYAPALVLLALSAMPPDGPSRTGRPA